MLWWAYYCTCNSARVNNSDGFLNACCKRFLCAEAVLSSVETSFSSYVECCHNGCLLFGFT